MFPSALSITDELSIILFFLGSYSAFPPILTVCKLQPPIHSKPPTPRLHWLGFAFQPSLHVTFGKVTDP